MVIKVSEHLLLLDENILAVCLISNQFNMVEKSTRVQFDKRFKLDPAVEKSAISNASVLYGIVRQLHDTFGQVEKITIDHEEVKLMLMALKDGGGFVGLALNKTANADYLALKISRILEETSIETLA